MLTCEMQVFNCILRLWCVSVSAVQALSYELFARILGLGFKSIPELNSGVVLHYQLNAGNCLSPPVPAVSLYQFHANKAN